MYPVNLRDFFGGSNKYCQRAIILLKLIINQAKLTFSSSLFSMPKLYIVQSIGKKYSVEYELHLFKILLILITYSK